MTDKQAVGDPQVNYDSPHDVLEDGSLSRKEKVKALENWAFTVRSRLDAVSEGMSAPPDGAYSRDTDLIRSIEKALETLAVPAEGEPPLTMRTGASGLAP